jgi:pentatricopeptide repeat protein
MREVNVAPNVRIYNMLLNVAAKNSRTIGNSTAVRMVWDNMKLDGIKPDKYSFNTLVTIFSRSGMLNEAFNVFQESRNHGVEPDPSMYNTLLSAFSKFGERSFNYTACLDQMEEVFDGFRSKGVTPNVLLYTTMIAACGRAGDTFRLCKYWEEMLAKNIKPTLHTYNTVMLGLARAKDMRRMIPVLQDFQKSGLQPDQLTLKGVSVLLARCTAQQPQSKDLVTFDELDVFHDWEEQHPWTDLELSDESSDDGLRTI